jgi:phage baseplate assembly protein W
MKPSCRYSQSMNDNILFTCLPIRTIRADFGITLCNFIFKNKSTAMRTLLIFSLSILRQNRL